MFRIKTWLRTVISLFFPDLCCACGRLLVGDERHLCLHCLERLPKTAYYHRAHNPVEEKFRARFPLQRAAAFLHFEKGGMSRQIVHRIKYRRDEALGVWCGELMYLEIVDSGFFEGVDLIVPVPLHKKKKRKRGFNQAEAIAEGISSLSGIPVDKHHLLKVKNNRSQTRRGRYERWLNSRESFLVTDPDALSGKHVLLIDDVVTTGATLEACAQSLVACKGLVISVLTLSVSR